MSTNSLADLKSPQTVKRLSSTLDVLPQLETFSPTGSQTKEHSNTNTRPVISYKDEMVTAFFTAMLEYVIDKKEECEDIESSCSLPTANVITSKDFKDLVDNDLLQQEVISIDGSQVSLGSKTESKTKKLRSKRTSSVASRRSTKSQGSIKSSTGSLSRKRKHIKSTSGLLPRISETDNRKDLADLHQDQPIENWRVKDSKEYVTITFKNDNTYEGPLQNHLFHGEGSFHWNDGTMYFGQFELGEISGFGKMTYADMSVYNGHFFNGKAHGMGAFYMSFSRTLYNGHWVHGKKQGRGWLYYSANNWYDGEWLDDCRSGFGTRLYRHGTKYTGMWKKGVRHGQGACTFSNGDFYSGEWLNGEMEGYGEYTWGGFFNKSLTFPVENIYMGQWIHGKRHGFGHLYFGLEHGARLVGFWDMNFKHGMGIIINSNGNITERNPLFYNDKPAHMTTSDEITLYNQSLTQQQAIRQQSFIKDHKYSLNSSIATPISSQGWLLRTAAHDASSITQTSLFSDFTAIPSIDEFLRSTNSKQMPNVYDRITGNSGQEQMSNVQKIERLQDFPQERLLCNPLILHTRTAPETLNLCFYVKKFIEEALHQASISAVSNTVFQQYASDHQLLADDLFWKETDEREVNHLRNLIWHNTSLLQTIYDMYANISNHADAPNRKCILIRLYLWQFYRDMLIYEYGVSIYETDEILLEHPGSCLETDHHPFERIYYWQFLWSLIGVAWKIHINKKNKVEPFQLLSIYIVFEEFLKTVVFPRAGHHKGPCLFEFKNLLPINDVIALYEDVGPLLTAREFLNECCCKKRTEPLCRLQYLGDNSVIQSEYGINTIAVGRNFVYLLDQKDAILPNNSPDTYPLEIDKFIKTLKVFRHIGPQRIINCLTLACPIIKKEGVIVNMEVKLTFLEFYETLIFCAYKSVLLASLKERCKNIVLDDDRGSRANKYDKPKRERRDSRKRKK